MTTLTPPDLVDEAMRVYFDCVRERRRLGKRPRGGYLNQTTERRVASLGAAATSLARAIDKHQRGHFADEALRAAIDEAKALLTTPKDLTS